MFLENHLKTSSPHVSLAQLPGLAGHTQILRGREGRQGLDSLRHQHLASSWQFHFTVCQGLHNWLF